uniref:Uncharacterized protein n=1 Tax=Plectus sambesii TaxID=2011161 RepID=A0A914XB38_9BILA
MRIELLSYVRRRPTWRGHMEEKKSRAVIRRWNAIGSNLTTLGASTQPSYSARDRRPHLKVFSYVGTRRTSSPLIANAAEINKAI